MNFKHQMTSSPQSGGHTNITRDLDKGLHIPKSLFKTQTLRCGFSKELSQ